MSSISKMRRFCCGVMVRGYTTRLEVMFEGMVCVKNLAAVWRLATLPLGSLGRSPAFALALERSCQRKNLIPEPGS